MFISYPAIVSSIVFCFFLLAVLPRFAEGEVSEACLRLVPVFSLEEAVFNCEEGLELCAARRDEERVPAMLDFFLYFLKIRLSRIIALCGTINTFRISRWQRDGMEFNTYHHYVICRRPRYKRAYVRSALSGTGLCSS